MNAVPRLQTFAYADDIMATTLDESWLKFEFGVVQNDVHLVDLKNLNKFWVASVDFYTADNRSEVSTTIAPSP